ncbi:MAG: hypothetical protein UT00_C0001G0105 [Parcubacteria group bacterium GW2011_GWA1_38_7]|nr:MAG: hypothetical protein UT00_C0001G0105 [Parcubacteria group bacterium GW2011_GWA1_38_7]
MGINFKFFTKKFKGFLIQNLKSSNNFQRQNTLNSKWGRDY